MDCSGLRAFLPFPFLLTTDTGALVQTRGTVPGGEQVWLRDESGVLEIVVARQTGMTLKRCTERSTWMNFYSSIFQAR